MKRSLTIFLSLAIIGIVLLGWWRGWYLWLEEHDVIFAALIQVVGLLIFGFLVNKWLADYNERKTARLERYKLQQKIHTEISSLTHLCLDKAMVVVYLKYMEATGDPSVGNNLRRTRSEFHDSKNQISVLASLSKYAFSSKLIDIVFLQIDNALLNADTVEFNHETAVEEYNKEIMDMVNAIHSHLRELISLMGDEIASWLVGDSK